MGIFNANAPRKEQTRRDLALRGLATTAVVAIILVLLTLNAQGKFSGAPRVKAELDNVGASLYVGADVKVQGVIVGKVTQFDAREGGATLELTLDGNELRGIPKNVVARVLPATVFGTSYVDLTVHGQPSEDRLAAHDVIHQDKTQATLEFQQALDDIDGLVKALGPADLATALSAIADALRGRGNQLGETFELADSLLGRYLSEYPLFREDLSLLASNIEIVRQNAPELLQATADGLVLAKTIVDQQGQLTALLTGGLATARDAERFIDENGSSLIKAIRGAKVVVHTTYDYRNSGIVAAFDANSFISTRLPNALHDGQLVLEGGVVASPPPYYTAADCPTYGSLRGSC